MKKIYNRLFLSVLVAQENHISIQEKVAGVARDLAKGYGCSMKEATHRLNKASRYE